jgi:hypothetical protein
VVAGIDCEKEAPTTWWPVIPIWMLMRSGGMAAKAVGGELSGNLAERKSRPQIPRGPDLSLKDGKSRAPVSLGLDMTLDGGMNPQFQEADAKARGMLGGQADTRRPHRYAFIPVAILFAITLIAVVVLLIIAA